MVVIIGPSGSGKSSVVRELAHRGLVTVHPTWTTRPRRRDEAAGSLEHRFVDEDEFDRLCQRRFFIETVTLFGLPYRYGLPALDDGGAGRTGPIDAVMLRAPLVARLAEHVPAMVVYQVADTADRTRARLLARDTSLEDAAARARDNEAEIALGRLVAHRTFVNDRSLDELVDEVAAALRVDVCAGCRADVAA